MKIITIHKNKSINVIIQMIRIHQTMKGTNILIRPGKVSLRNCLLGWEQVWLGSNFVRVNLLCEGPVRRESRISWGNWGQASYFGTPKKKNLQSENEKTDRKIKIYVGNVLCQVWWEDPGVSSAMDGMIILTSWKDFLLQRGFSRSLKMDLFSSYNSY